MRDSGSLGIDEVEKQGGLDTGTTLGRSHMMSPIYNHAREHADVYGVFFNVSGL